MKKDRDREQLLSIAADEGRHAAILKQYTKKQLTPASAMKNGVLLLYRIIGKKALFLIMSKVETSAYKTYEPYFEKYPEMKSIAADELKHGKILLAMQ